MIDVRLLHEGVAQPETPNLEGWGFYKFYNQFWKPDI